MRTALLKQACTDAGQYGLNVSASHYVERGIRLLRTTDLGGAAAAEGGVFLPGPIGNRYIVRAGDLLLSRAGTIGQAYLASASDEGSSFAGYLIRFRPSAETDPRFLYYATQSANFQAQVMAEAVVSTIANFNADRYANMPIPLADLTRQRRIADFLDDQVARIDNIIAARRTQIDLLKRETSAALDALFQSDEASRTTRLGHFVRRIEQGWSPQCEAVPAEEGEWGVVKVSAVRLGQFVAGENKRLPSSLQPAREYEIRPGDLLITRANTPALVGAIAVVPRDVRSKLILSDKIMRIDLDAALDPNYVALIGQTSAARDRLSGAGTGTSQSMVNIRGADIRDLPIVVRSRREQARLVATYDQQVASARHGNALLSVQMDSLVELKRSLITAAVTGSLT